METDLGDAQRNENNRKYNSLDDFYIDNDKSFV